MAGLLLASELMAITPDPQANHYQSISERNAFGLKPPPSVEPPAPPAPQLPKLILTGITTILGDKRALLKALSLATHPGQAAKEESMILAEGQRQGSLEVLNIDENAGSVRVNNSGTIMTLTFEKDGAKLPETPVRATNPPALPFPTNTLLRQATSAPSAYPVRPTHKANQRTFPARDVRSPAVPGQTPPTGLTVPPVPGAASTPIQLPQDLTAEEQAILQELQRQTATPPGTTPAVPQAPVPGPPVPPNPVLPQ